MGGRWGGPRAEAGANSCLYYPRPAAGAGAPAGEPRRFGVRVHVRATSGSKPMGCVRMVCGSSEAP